FISIERYFKRKFPSINGDGEESIPKLIPETIPDPILKHGPIPSSSDGIDLGTLLWDPSERPSIFSYDPNIRDEIRRKDSIGKQGGNDAFVTYGLNSWSKKYGLNNHVGEVNSYHNKSLQKCELLLKKKQSIHVAFKKQIEGEAKDYGMRLNLLVETCRLLLKASLPFCGHDEEKHSMNRGIFLELYELRANQNEEIRKVVACTPLNCTLKSPRTNGTRFAILGIVKERFVGVVHVKDTSSVTLKASIDTLFAQHKLSLKQVRGQGYDRESNMPVAKHHEGLVKFFEKLIGVINVVSSSCKRKDMIQDNYKALQTKDQNILEVVSMINGTKESLMTLRANEFDGILKKVNIFCAKYDIEVLKMDEAYATKRNQIIGITNRYYFEIDIFNTVLDMQIQEFGDHFGEISTHLLSNMSALSPHASFSMFDSSKLINLTTLYPDDFTNSDRFHLMRELDLYHVNVV
nr:hypothetical protein [Tanacetum cinerariifolium]